MFRLSVLFVFLSAVPALAEFNYRQFQKYETQSPQFSSAALRGGMRLHVENDPELETAPLGKVVLAGLQLLFPCE